MVIFFFNALLYVLVFLKEKRLTVHGHLKKKTPYDTCLSFKKTPYYTRYSFFFF